MGGISQCPICGDLYYGDERDDYQTCRCARQSMLQQLRELDERIDALEATKSDAKRELVSLRRTRTDYVRRIKETSGAPFRR
jgi:hypothetical protein